MTDRDLQIMLRREMESAEPPLQLDLDGLRRRGQRRRSVLAACSGLAAVTVLVTVAAVAIGLRPDASTQAGMSGATDVPVTSSAGPSERETGTGTGDSIGVGSDRVITLSSPLTTEGNGTTTVSLGPRPSDATAVSTDLRCLSPGNFKWPDGASLRCGDADFPSDPNHRTSPGYIIQLEPAQDELIIKTERGAAFEIVTTYIKTEFVPAPVNANGDTYGADNEHGTPDLIAVVATNGTKGYSYARDFAELEPEPTSPADALAQQQANEGKTLSVPVYESDGSTQIGTFVIG